MKKIFLKTATIMALLGAADNANAQLSNLLGDLASKFQSQTQNSDNSLLQAIGGIVSDKLIPTETQIIGTWAYEGPAVLFGSENALKGAAGSVASKQVEEKLQTYLTRIGIDKGQMLFTFEEDKTFYVTRKNKKVATGTYIINNKEIELTFKGRKNPCPVTPQIESGTLVVVVDATKLKTFFEGIGSKIPQMNTIVTLMKTMDSMKVGVRLQKQ